LPSVAKFRQVIKRQISQIGSKNMINGKMIAEKVIQTTTNTSRK
jgi:hypothetical protein